MTHADILAANGLTADLAPDPAAGRDGATLAVRTPVDGAEIARLNTHSDDDLAAMTAAAVSAFAAWRDVPPPRRGELVRLLGEELRAAKENLGRLVSLESGKILQEGLGEVQEMIDICDFAVGLSRQLYGLTIASERPGHAMRETWHPLGVCGVITSFNFPVAPWAWNTALALVCGDPVIWKPSEKTPLCALAVQKIYHTALARFGAAADLPPDLAPGLMQVVLGRRGTGDALARSRDVAVVSATGSTRMGRAGGPAVAERFGRCILELGGNNAMIVAPSADIEMAIRAIVFSAVGTAGQRCTSLRRLIVHEDIYDRVVPRLKAAYDGLPVGDPLDPGVLVGPLIDGAAFEAMAAALAQAAAARLPTAFPTPITRPRRSPRCRIRPPSSARRRLPRSCMR